MYNFPNAEISKYVCWHFFHIKEIDKSISCNEHTINTTSERLDFFIKHT